MSSASRAAASPPVPSPQAWPEADASHLLVTSAQMADLEAGLFASGLPVESLMEKAALAVSRQLLQRLSDQGPEGPHWSRGDGVVVLVGPGHNGGDGLVVARELHLAGVPVRLWCPFERLRPLCETHLRHALWLGVPRLEEPPEGRDDALWVDALFGIGQNRAPGAELEALLQERQRQRPGRLAAIDVPTGLCADSGRRLGATAAMASLTWSIGLIKRGLVQDAALAHVGRLERIDLALPADLLASLPPSRPLGLTAADQRQAPRPQPLPDAAKYGRGRLLVVAGSRAYPGAAHLALLGAGASGCGSLRALLPPDLSRDLWQVLPHVIALPAEGACRDGSPLASLAAGAGHLLDRGRLDAVLIGPGLGLDRSPGEDRLWPALGRFAGLLVLDADGLNRLAAAAAGEPALDWLRRRQGPTWLTPHAGEFARLFPSLADLPPLEAAARAARESGATVLLKGARSVIADPAGGRWQLLEASSAAARAGLGDVLAGYAAGWGAVGMAAEGRAEGSLLAVAGLDHALAGMRLAEAGTGQVTPMAVARQLGLSASG
ncbi:MAG: NAD(P)H-hydrate epimerase [Synechococcaceae cyanobacterium]|nr:NAD(P)H-hydrate epimerase [Synechococcaceae cyanobacterium]